MAFNLQESVLCLQDPDEILPINNEIDVPHLDEADVAVHLESRFTHCLARYSCGCMT
jgi:hypothetical protein